MLTMQISFVGLFTQLGPFKRKGAYYNDVQ